MRKTLLAIGVVLLAGWATAQTMIPISAYSSTYSYTRMRGFFFQSPTDFTIVQLRVPDEKKHGTQHVLIFKPTAQPPSWTTPTYTPPLFYGTGPSANKLSCNIPVNQGAWLGVLGGCGDTTVTHNSYGSGPYASNVLGSACTLTRFITQTNVPQNKGIAATYGSSTGSIGRVEVYVLKGAGANITPAGTGVVGTTVTLGLTSTADPGRAYQVGTSLGKGPIPIDTRTLALSPDLLLALSISNALPTVFQNYAGTLDKSGQATAKLVIPNVAVLKGIGLYTSFVTLLATAPSGIGGISPEWLLTIS
jgi:hypothetical protein